MTESVAASNRSESIAKVLLEKRAVVFNLENPFTYVSGMRSPIYCDNRLILAYPVERGIIVQSFLSVLDAFSFDIVVGIATAGIPWASWLADRLDKPLAYVRGEKKNRGMGRQIEGAVAAGKRAVVIEDLVSTGGSSFRAVEALRSENVIVECVAAIFTYELPQARETFEKGDCRLEALTSFPSLLEVALDMKYLSANDIETAKEWNKDPFAWGPKFGFPNEQARW